MGRMGNMLKYAVLGALTVAALATLGAAGVGIAAMVTGKTILGITVASGTGLAAYGAAAMAGIKGLLFGGAVAGGMSGMVLAAGGGSVLGAVRGALAEPNEGLPYPPRETSPEYSPEVQAARAKERQPLVEKPTQAELDALNRLQAASPAEKQAYMAARGNQPGLPMQPTLPG